MSLTRGANRTYSLITARSDHGDALFALTPGRPDDAMV